MARGINRVTLVGYVGADPELMHSEQGNPICNISLATTEGWRDMNGQVQTRTEWHRVVFFKRLAEVSAQFLRKGSCAYVEGRLSTNRWTDQQGIVRYTTEIIGTEMQVLKSPLNEHGGDDYAAPDGSYGNYSSGYGREGRGNYRDGYQAPRNPNLKRKPYSQKGRHGPSDVAAGFRSGQYGPKGALLRSQSWAKGQKQAAPAAEHVQNERHLNDDGIDPDAPL